MQSTSYTDPLELPPERHLTATLPPLLVDNVGPTLRLAFNGVAGGAGGRRGGMVVLRTASSTATGMKHEASPSPVWGSPRL